MENDIRIEIVLNPDTGIGRVVVIVMTWNEDEARWEDNIVYEYFSTETNHVLSTAKILTDFLHMINVKGMTVTNLTDYHNT